MIDFARQYGEWDSYHEDYKWQKLVTAARYYGYEFKAHDSMNDVFATLYVYQMMQEGKKQKFSVYEAALKASQATCTENCPAFQSEQEDRQYGYPGAGL